MATELISNKGTNGEPVTYADGSIASGVRIIAYHTGGDFASDGDIITTTTDSNGEYAFTDADLPATHLKDETAKTNYVHLFAEIGSGSSPRQATPIRPWQGYSLAQEVLIDNFEDDSASPTGPYASGDDITTYYNGATGPYSRISSGDVINDSKSLQADDSGNADEIIISEPGDGLPFYPSEGGTVQFLVKDIGAARNRPRVLFNSSYDANNDTATTYGLRMAFDIDEITIIKYIDADVSINGGGTFITSVSSSLSIDTIYLVECDLRDSNDNVAARLYSTTTDSNGNHVKNTKKADISTTDTDIPKTNRGIGYQINNGDGPGIAFDNVEVVK